MANNPESPVCAQADIGVTLDTGPEAISGSPSKGRNLAKIALNAFRRP